MGARRAASRTPWPSEAGSPTRSVTMLRIFARAGRIEAVGLVGYAAWIHVHPTHAVALQIPHRTARTVDWQLMEVRAAEPADLGTRCRKTKAPLRVVEVEIDPRNHMTRSGTRPAPFRRRVDWVAVEHHPPNDLDGNNFLRNDLGRVQNVEVETGRLLLVERLNAKLPLGKKAPLAMAS